MPNTIEGLADVVEVALGFEHTCARTQQGNVLCWGLGDFGQNGGTKDRKTPELVSGVSGATSLMASARQSCAIVADGRVVCWGLNDVGQLGSRADLLAHPVAAEVPGFDGVDSLAIGTLQTCAVKEGAATCWGDTYATRAGSIVDATTVSSCDLHHCLIHDDETVSCWGLDDKGQIGDGPPQVEKTSPQHLDLPLGATHVRVGWRQTCAIAGGRATCWGYGDVGQLGNGVKLTDASFDHVDVLLPADVAADDLYVGWSHACVRANGGRQLWCWGAGDMGQIGDGNSGPDAHRPTPVSIDWEP